MVIVMGKAPVDREFRPFFKCFLFTYPMSYSESPINYKHFAFCIFFLLHFFQKLWRVKVKRKGQFEGQNAPSLTIGPMPLKSRHFDFSDFTIDLV